MASLKKESATARRERDDLGSKFKVLEKELRKTVKDVQPKKAQASLKKLLEGIEKNSLVQAKESSPIAAAASAGLSETDQACQLTFHWPCANLGTYRNSNPT